MLKADHLVKSFGSNQAVDDISFEIKSGEIVGLLGPNGAGKTTTMRLIAGFFAADKGDTYINDLSVTKHPQEAQKLIGYLPESNPLYSDLLVCDFLRLSAQLKDIVTEDIASALDFAINATDIESVYYQPISELSKGYRQRVGLAATILNKPEIIILDEPTEGLDPNQRTEIRNLIKGLGKKHTIIISTHVMQEASSICNRLLVINNGKLIADGTTEQLAKTSGHKEIITLEIEGTKVEKELGTIQDAEIVSMEKNKQGRYIAKLSPTKKTVVLPVEISKLAHKNRWIIWRLMEEENHLEDIFYSLTK